MRKVGLLVFVMALMVAACGRQVTFPSYAANGGLPAGWMAVDFTVYQAFSFSANDYIIVFNTSGNGITPLPGGGAQNNYAGFSDAIIVSGNASGVVEAQPVQFYFSSNEPGTIPAVEPLNVPSQDIILNANYNGAGTEFRVEFDRAIFSSLAPTPTPSASPTSAPSPSTSPSTSPSPTPSPTPKAVIWLDNCFVTSQGTTTGSYSTYTPDDSLGLGGASDTSFSSPQLNVTTTFDITENALGTTAPTPSEEIQSCDFQNTP